MLLKYAFGLLNERREYVRLIKLKKQNDYRLDISNFPVPAYSHFVNVKELCRLYE